MGVLDSFEHGLERVVNGAFAKTFRARLEPLEIAAALKQELDTHSEILSRDHIAVPNDLKARISAADFQRLRGTQPQLADELVADLKRYASSHGYQFTGPVMVSIVPDRALTIGMIEVSSRSADRNVSLVPMLDIAGRQHPLKQGVTVLGRANDADVTIADSAVSKHHASISWDGRAAVLTDLSSTNGTKVNGERITRAELDSPQAFRIGSTTVTFRLVPQAVG